MTNVSSIHQSAIFCWLAAVALVLTFGCGTKSDLPSLGTVTGTVTLNGEPLRQVEISFNPTKGRPSYAKTDDEGKYELTYIRDIKGAKIDEHRVIVHSPKVDNAQRQLIPVKAGPQVIDIKCLPNPNPPNPEDAGEI